MSFLALAACGGSNAASGGPDTAAEPEDSVAATSVASGTVSDGAVAATDPPSTDVESTTASATEAPTTTAPPATTTPPVEDPFEVVRAAVGEPTPRYDDESLWLCRGEATDGLCRDDLDTTAFAAADGTATVVERAAADDPPADCFFVYETVDLSPGPGNTSLAEPLDPALRAGIERVTSQQAAPFSTTCRVYAPLYEQATFGASRLRDPSPPDLASGPFDVAYTQVLDAFRWYMANENEGRPIVLLGHSQGAQHLARLAAELFDPSPELTEQLAVALLLGPGGHGVNVAPGEVVGGSFESLPLCTGLAEAGCVIAYNTYLADTPPVNWWAAGSDSTSAACVSPSELVDGNDLAAESTFDYPLVGPEGIANDLSVIGLGEVSTRFVSYPDAYTATCTTDGTRTWLEIAPADPADPRPTIPLEIPQLTDLDLGLHLLDYQLQAGDLATLTEAKIATVLGG